MPTLTTLYYISKQPVGLIIPKVSKGDYGDQSIPHISFNTKLQGCLTDANRTADLLGERFHVYGIETDKYYQPSLSEVPDRDATGEVWVQFACEPEYLYDIEVIRKKGEHIEEINGDWCTIPDWEIKILEQEALTEDTRVVLVNKSKTTGPYKNQMRGKNRFERKKHSQIAKTVKQYNKIDMNKLFKEDILEVSIPVIGETDNYTVNIRLEGIVKELAKNIKSNKNQLEFKTVVQSITKIFNSGNVWVKCSCPDYKYRFAHWNIVNRVSVDDTSKDPGPGKGIRNPKDQLGRGCKHVLLCLANGDWVMKVASVINNYIHYAEEHLQKPFLKLIFPKLYGFPADEMVEQDIIDTDEFLDSTSGLIDAINEYGRNRGKMKKGSNINPVYADKLSAEQKKQAEKAKQAEEPKNKPQTAEKPKEATKPTEKESTPEAKKTKPETASKAEEADEAKTQKK